MKTIEKRIDNNLTSAMEVEEFLLNEAMPTVQAMRALFKAIEAMTKDTTIEELASHGRYLGDVIHNDIDVTRERMADARSAAAGAQA